MIRLLIADDHAVVRAGLKNILEETRDITVRAEASTGPEVIEQVRKETFDVILLDIFLPKKNGFEVLKSLKVFKPRLPILILSINPEAQFAIRFIKAGAAGYLTKWAEPAELVKAIRTVAAGKRYITSSLGERLALYFDDDIDTLPHEKLSDREYEVFLMLAEGKSTHDIAEALSLSPNTISTYRARIFEKMHLENVAQLIHYAIKYDLVDLAV